jgi:hypothetical protein
VISLISTRQVAFDIAEARDREAEIEVARYTA